MWNNRTEKIFSEFTNGYDFVLIIENEKKLYKLYSNCNRSNRERPLISYDNVYSFYICGLKVMVHVISEGGYKFTTLLYFDSVEKIVDYINEFSRIKKEKLTRILDNYSSENIVYNMVERDIDNRFY